MEATVQNFNDGGLTPNMTEMSVYHALSMRKVYANEIAKMKETSGDTSGFVIVKTQSELKDPEENTRLENTLKAKYDKFLAVQRNFYALNAAIQQSNATTKVTIGDKEYTIAEAIARYDRLNAEINFYNGVAKNIVTAVSNMEDRNRRVLSNDAIENYVNNAIKSLPDGTISGEEEITRMRENLKEKYIADNTAVVVDPYGLRDKIEEKLSELKTFKAEYNEMLNATNLTTRISVNLVSD